MVVKNSKAATASIKKKQQEPVKLVYIVLLIGYGFVTVLTPNLQTMDSSGPKFLSFAMLNLATFIFLFTRKELKSRPQWYFAFFRNGIGIAYTGLMVVSLLSFLKAINVLESVLLFSKIFTTFSAAYLISILLTSDRRNISYLCAAMTFLLIFDSTTVFLDIYQEITSGRLDISAIKSGYGNKNMFASAIFVKIPFALWLMIYNRKWLRILGIIGIPMAIVAVLFLSARAFYLGIFALTILLLLFFIVRFKQSNDKYQLRLTGFYLMLVLFSFLVFSITQRYFYPQRSGYTLSVKERLATISDSDGGGGRLDAWKRSWHVFKKEPLLGVGLGNWKIATLQEESKRSADLVFLVQSHNDFIQCATETGIFGGVLFLSLFLLVGLAFLRAMSKDHSDEKLKLLFIPVFGLFCYGIDAFFNFPRERPEMQSLFALYTGMAAVFLCTNENVSPILRNSAINSFLFNHFRIRFFDTFLSKLNRLSFLPIFRVLISYTFGLFLVVTVYILYQNFISLKQQLIVRKDIIDGKLTISASAIINGFPCIPNLTIDGEPIAIQKSQYLMNEKRNEEAITLLKNDKSNPYHPLINYHISMAYRNLNNLDSSLVYARKLYKIKPDFFENISILCNMLEQKGFQQESTTVIDNYLARIKGNKTAWLYASELYIKTGDTEKATSVIDSAAHYFPKDSLILKEKSVISRKAVFAMNKTLIESANYAYQRKKYGEAIRLYSELLIKEPTLFELLNYRALCYYYEKDYANCIKDLTVLISLKSGNVNLYNLYNMLGTNYYMLGKIDQACSNFKIAADMGDKDGLNNYAKLCQKGK